MNRLTCAQGEAKLLTVAGTDLSTPGFLEMLKMYFFTAFIADPIDEDMPWGMLVVPSASAKSCSTWLISGAT